MRDIFIDIFSLERREILGRTSICVNFGKTLVGKIFVKISSIGSMKVNSILITCLKKTLEIEVKVVGRWTFREKVGKQKLWRSAEVRQRAGILKSCWLPEISQNL